MIQLTYHRIAGQLYTIARKNVALSIEPDGTTILTYTVVNMDGSRAAETEPEVSHPPIPDHPLFGHYRDGVAFFQFRTSGVSHKYPLEDKDRHYWERNPDLRKMCAAVAYKAWMMEADKQHDVIQKEQWFDNYDDAAKSRSREIEYKANAAAWIAWENEA